MFATGCMLLGCSYAWVALLSDRRESARLGSMVAVRKGQSSVDARVHDSQKVTVLLKDAFSRMRQRRKKQWMAFNVVNAGF